VPHAVQYLSPPWCGGARGLLQLQQIFPARRILEVEARSPPMGEYSEQRAKKDSWNFPDGFTVYRYSFLEDKSAMQCGLRNEHDCASRLSWQQVSLR